MPHTGKIDFPALAPQRLGIGDPIVGGNLAVCLQQAAKDLTRPNAEILRFAQSLCVRVWRGRLARVFCSEPRARRPRHRIAYKL